MKFTPRAKNGDALAPVEGKKFTHYIDKIAFQFVVHPCLQFIGAMTISHYSSGHRVVDLTPFEVECAGNPTKAAKAKLDDLAAKYPSGRVSAVLRAAEGS